jgi:phospholipid/cholesterol/gamma-HCH transport system substrate-binding protein
MTTRRVKVGLAGVLVLALIAGLFVALRSTGQANRTHVVGYFANSSGIFVGDDVRILGVPVGKIDQIEPQGTDVKIGFWYDGDYKVPADAKAVILSPSLVSARAVQLTPAYVDGPAMGNDAVIPQERTAVPVEWDDFRKQLEKLTASLEPTSPGGVSTLGALINTAADNLRGRGADIRQTMIEVSQAVSVLGDHSNDIFGTVKSLSMLVSALRDSAGLLQQLNQNLATVTGTLSNDPDEVGNAIRDVNAVVGDVQSFIAANREPMGTASDKLASITGALVQSLDDIKQALHVGPNTFQNFINIYHPAQAATASALVAANFSNPISFLCGAIQAASRMNAEQSAKLCVQYLAPIVKNRQFNFPPLGFSPFAGAIARPNEVTYSEDWMRPDYVPPQPAPPAAAPISPDVPPLAAEAPGAPAPDTVQTNPADGLQGLMTPPGAGS